MLKYIRALSFPLAVMGMSVHAAPISRPHVAWAHNATIYEVNLRQYTPEGSIRAFEVQIPRLKRMGVKLLWIMPFQPIGVLNRKGPLGSYYSVRDYKAVNPEFGTLADFKHLVATAHAQGMKVIIDWVANHTAWDNPWVAAHPEWYKKGEHGEIIPVRYGTPPHVEEWSDVAALDYSQAALWPAMIDAMAFWVRTADIDGFRCDVAAGVPEPFWARAVGTLDAIKPMFMLAEADDPKLQVRAFDMTYDWKLYDLMVAIAKGQKSADDLRAYYAAPAPGFSPDMWRAIFTSNHDKNSWEGSDTEQFGAAFEPFAALAATLPGIPLIYGGQEAVLDKRLKFFEKDPIEWKGYPRAALYHRLIALKTNNAALRNGSSGGALEIVDTGNRAVFAFRRRVPGNSVVVAANLSGSVQTLTKPVAGVPASLPAWGYKIVVR